MVVSYLNEHLEIQKSKILRLKHSDLSAVSYIQGCIEGLETFLDLPQDLEKVRIPTEEEKAAILKSRADFPGRSQAVVMGQTKYQR